jgi:hypothetical protein
MTKTRDSGLHCENPTASVFFWFTVWESQSISLHLADNVRIPQQLFSSGCSVILLQHRVYRVRIPWHLPSSDSLFENLMTSVFIRLTVLECHSTSDDLAYSVRIPEHLFSYGLQCWNPSAIVFIWFTVWEFQNNWIHLIYSLNISWYLYSFGLQC